MNGKESSLILCREYYKKGFTKNKNNVRFLSLFEYLIYIKSLLLVRET